MNGPTWSDVATAAKKIERRDFALEANHKLFRCPFCKVHGWASALKKSTGHRCDCGALFYTQQAVAVHFKDREADA